MSASRSGISAPSGTGVAWGVDRYDAADDASDALRSTRRAGSPSAATSTDRLRLAADVADALLQLQYKTWDFGDSVAFEALIAASDALGDERWARFAHGWGRAWATRRRPFVRLDCTAPGRALLGLASKYEDAQLLSACRELADYLMTRETLDGVYETWDRSPLLAPYSGVAITPHHRRLLDDPPPGVFVDCLHFDPPFLTALGVATGEPHYLDEGIEQALGYIRLLQTPGGLFDHFALRGEQGSFGPGWGRGQGWAILGLLEVVQSVQDAKRDRDREALEVIRDSARRLLDAMLKTQRGDGHWHAVVTDSASGDEFSTAGFMASALASAIRMKVVEGEEMRRGMLAARAAIERSLDDDAQLREVSAAVYASTEPSHYARVPRGYVVPWGQGPALLALVAEVAP